MLRCVWYARTQHEYDAAVLLSKQSSRFGRERAVPKPTDAIYYHPLVANATHGLPAAATRAVTAAATSG